MAGWSQPPSQSFGSFIHESESTGTSVAAFDPGSTQNNRCDRPAVQSCHERDTDCTPCTLVAVVIRQALWKQYNWRRRWQPAVEKGQSQSILDFQRFYFQGDFFFFFTTAFHDVCISWRKPLFYFISLPNALFIFQSSDVLGRHAQIVFSHFPSVYEQKWTVHFPSLWFGKPSTFHKWQPV